MRCPVSRVSGGSTCCAGPGRESGPPRGAQRGLHRLLYGRGVVLIRDRIESRRGRSTGDRRITRRGSGRPMVPVVTNPLPTSAVGRHVIVDPFPTELIIDRCVTHAATP
jgi:hypothetical protein